MPFTLIDGESLYWAVNKTFDALYRDREKIDYSEVGLILTTEREKLGWKAGEFYYLLKNGENVDRFAKYLEKIGFIPVLLNGMNCINCITPSMTYVLGRMKDEDEILVLSHDSNILPIIDDLSSRGKKIATCGFSYINYWTRKNIPHIDLDKYMRQLFHEEYQRSQLPGSGMALLKL